MSRRRKRSRFHRSADATVRSLPAPGQFFSSVRVREQVAQLDEEEYPSRQVALASQLIELVNQCPEVASALDIICAYVLSSGTGDELGFAIVPDENNPQPQTVAIARDVVARSFAIFGYWQIVWRMCAWGDAFIYLDIDTKQMRINSAELLPTWQVHAIPDQDGRLSHYEQRFPWMSEAPIIPASNLIQISHNRRFLYGRSLWRECVHPSMNEWQALKDADYDLRQASRTVGVQPNVHTMPQGADESYKRAYRQDHEAQKNTGLISDIYLLHGAQVSKPMGMPSIQPLGGLMDHFNRRLTRIANRSRVPAYLLGLETKYAREIAYQPALSFVVFVGLVRQELAAGIRQLVNTELALKNVPIKSWAYQIVFPKINVNPWQPAVDEDVNQPGVIETE